MAFNYIKPAPEGSGSPDNRERCMDMAKPLTPKGERPRATYGSLEMSVQTVSGLCQVGRKCVRRVGHAEACWPLDSGIPSNG